MSLDKSPHSAVSVWVEGFSLCIRIPRSHSLRLPLNKFDRDGNNIGYEIFLNLMRERERGRGTIGTKFAPVQHDLDKAVRDWTKAKPAPKKPRPGTEEQRKAAAEVVAKLLWKS